MLRIQENKEYRDTCQIIKSMNTVVIYIITTINQSNILFSCVQCKTKCCFQFIT